MYIAFAKACIKYALVLFKATKVIQSREASDFYLLFFD